MSTTTPTPIQEVHVGDVGLLFVVTVMDADGVVNLSNANLIHMLFQKPDLSLLTVTASLATDGVDGVVTYSTRASDLDQSGTWRHQAYVEIGPDQKWSNINKFKVYPNLPLSS